MFPSFVPAYGFKSAGFDHCAIVVVRQQTWQEQTILIDRSWSLASFARRQLRASCFKLEQFQPKAEGDRLLLWRASPDHARHLVGQGNRRPLNALAGGELSQPHVETVRLFHPLLQDGMSTLER